MKTGSIKSALLYLLFPASQVFLLFPQFFSGDTDASGGLLVSLILIALCVAADLALAAAIRSLRDNTELQARKASLERQIGQQEDYCRSLAEHFTRLRVIRHDLANHVYTVKILSEEGRAEEAASYIEEFQKNTRIQDLSGSHIVCGNGGLAE